MIKVGRLNEFKVESMPISPDEVVKEYAKFLKDKHLASASKNVTANKISNTTYRLGFTKSSCYVPENIDEEFAKMMKKKHNITDRYTLYHGPSGVEFHYENMNESAQPINEAASNEKDIAKLRKMYARQLEIQKFITKNGFEAAMKYKDEYHKLLGEIGKLAQQIDGPGAIHGKGILYQIDKELNESVSLNQLQNAQFSSSFMNDRASINIDNQTYVKVGKNKWEHIPANPHAFGGFYSDQEIYDKASSSKLCKLDESSQFNAMTPNKKLADQVRKLVEKAKKSNEGKDAWAVVDFLYDYPNALCESVMNESAVSSQPYFKVEKYNDTIIKVITNPKDHRLSSNLKKALDNLHKQKKINGYLSSPGKYEVYHNGNLLPNKLVDILIDYTGDGDRVPDEYRPNDIIKVMI